MRPGLLITLTLPLAALGVLSGCSPAPVRNAPLPPALLAQPALSPELTRLQASLVAWQALREQLPRGYRYKVLFTSFSGLRQATTVVVKDRRVVERRLESQGPGAATAWQLQWVETGAGIGGHGIGAAPLTLDELYARARQVIESPLRPHERLVLSVDGRGLLSACYIVDSRIADDAPKLGVPPLELDLNPP